MHEIERESYYLRPVTETDLPRILEIERQAYPFPWTEDAFSNELIKPFSHVMALIDEAAGAKLVGYIVYWLLFDEAHVLNVTVDPQERRKGLGHRLMKRVMTDALRKDMKRIFLEVRTSNAAAIALYKKLGFFEDHVKKGFYEDGEDAIFMVRYFDRAGTPTA